MKTDLVERKGDQVRPSTRSDVRRYEILILGWLLPQLYWHGMLKGRA